MNEFRKGISDYGLVLEDGVSATDFNFFISMIIVIITIEFYFWFTGGLLPFTIHFGRHIIKGQFGNLPKRGWGTKLKFRGHAWGKVGAQN